MKPRGGNSVMASRQKVSAEEIAADPRNGLDFFPTPPWATRALLQHVLAIDEAAGAKLLCWEPCCGEGHMAEPLKEVFAAVYASDVYPHGYGNVGSFVGIGGLDIGDLASCPFPPDWIITNPPFNIALEIARRAIAEARKGVALLVRLSWLESEDRHAFFEQFPPTYVATFSERVSMVKHVWDPKANLATAYAWFVWIKPIGETRPQGPRFIGQIIPPGCKDRLTRPSDFRLAKREAQLLIGGQP